MHDEFASDQSTEQVDRSLISFYYELAVNHFDPYSRQTLLPPRSMVGRLPLEQHIGVRIPGGQPIA